MESENVGDSHDGGDAPQAVDESVKNVLHETVGIP